MFGRNVAGWVPFMSRQKVPESRSLSENALKSRSTLPELTNQPPAKIDRKRLCCSRFHLQPLLQINDVGYQVGGEPYPLIA